MLGQNYLDVVESKQTFAVLSGQMQAVSLLQVLSHLLVVQVSFEPLEQEPNANASVKVRIKLFISIFLVCWDGEFRNLDLSVNSGLLFL